MALLDTKLRTLKATGATYKAYDAGGRDPHPEFWTAHKGATRAGHYATLNAMSSL